MRVGEGGSPIYPGMGPHHKLRRSQAPLMLWHRWVKPRQVQEIVREVGRGHHNKTTVLNPNDHQTQRLRLWEGEVGWVQWAGRGGRAPDSLPHSKNPKAKVLVWLWARFPQAPGFKHTGLQEGCGAELPGTFVLPWIWAQFSRVLRKGGALIHCSPGCFPMGSEASLSYPAYSGRGLILFSVLAGEGQTPKAGGLHGAPTAPGVGLPAALSSTTTATGSQTAAA